MATVQAIQPVSLTPAAPIFVNADGTGHSIASNGGKVILIARNADAAARTITIAPTQNTRVATSDFPQMTVPNLSFNIPAGTDRVMGPFPACFTDANGRLPMTFSATANLSIAAMEVTPV